MKLKLGIKGAKILKAIHIVFITLWIGGLLTWIPVINGMQLKDVDATYTTYLNLRAIAWNVIGWGGIGSFLTGLLNSFLTNWGLFRHKWVIVKFIGTISMIVCGMFYTEEKMLTNIEFLEKENTAVLQNPVFLANHHDIIVIVPIQIAVFIAIVFISVLKPWMQKRQ